MNSFHHDLIAALPKLKARALNLTRNRSAADDLLQDTVERALRHQASFEAGTNLVAWLCTIMRNSFINQHRIAGRFVPCDPQGEALSQISVEPCQEDIVFLGQVAAAVTALPAVPRQAMLLAIDGVPAAEVAQLQGVAEGTIKSRLSRTRSAMRAWAEGAAA